MKAPRGLSDTDPAAERVQIELLRRATVAQRVQLALALSATTARLAWRAIERANPEASQAEIALIFAAVHYGETVAAGLRSRLMPEID